MDNKNIPIVIISYNNYKYVENTIKQIKNINESYFKNIIILDNYSTCNKTINYLKTVDCRVIRNETNNGPWITPNNNSELYNELPNKFILTDPDLQFNENLPNNFIEILSELSDQYKPYKLGFALYIDDFDKMYQGIYVSNENKNFTIYDWEIQYWEKKINDNRYELYYAGVDTTFCLVNKLYMETSLDKGLMRIAGNFTAKHLPWYVTNNIHKTIYDNYIFYIIQTEISTAKRLFLEYLSNNYSIVNKNNEIFLINKIKNDENLPFWTNVFTSWESDTFSIFDKYLNKDKIFIDIGGWIGTTCMYGSRKSKHVYCVEADIYSFKDMTENCNINCKNNYTLINKAIYNVDDIELHFGKNKILLNSKINDSTSQIYFEDDSNLEQCYKVKTITIKAIIENYNISTNDVSLIKVDIEGGEEFILDDLYNIYIKYKIPMYISFHYSWWKNKDLNRFLILSENNKNEIQNFPFTSILFT